MALLLSKASSYLLVCCLLQHSRVFLKKKMTKTAELGNNPLSESLWATPFSLHPIIWSDKQRNGCMFVCPSLYLTSISSHLECVYCWGPKESTVMLSGWTVAISGIDVTTCHHPLVGEILWGSYRYRHPGVLKPDVTSQRWKSLRRDTYSNLSTGF